MEPVERADRSERVALQEQQTGLPVPASVGHGSLLPEAVGGGGLMSSYATFSCSEADFFERPRRAANAQRSW